MTFSWGIRILGLIKGLGLGSISTFHGDRGFETGSEAASLEDASLQLTGPKGDHLADLGIGLFNASELLYLD